MRRAAPDTALDALSREGLEQMSTALQSYTRSLARQGIRPSRDYVLLASEVLSRSMSGQDGSGLADLLRPDERSVMPPGPLLLDLEQACSLLALSSSTVKRLTQAGELPSVKVGGNRRYRVADLEAFVADLKDAA